MKFCRVLHWSTGKIFLQVSLVQVTFTTGFALTDICGQCVLPNSSQPTGWIDMKCDIPWKLTLQIKASSRCSKFGNFWHTIKVSCITQNTVNLWHTIKASSKIKSRRVILWDTIKANSITQSISNGLTWWQVVFFTGWFLYGLTCWGVDLWTGWLFDGLICWQVDFLTG